MNLAEEIKKNFKGEVLEDEETLKKYSRDASLFEVRPKLVVFPKDSEDIQSLVRYIASNKSSNPTLSLTMRAAGSDMTGGPLNESIIADVTKHMNHIGDSCGVNILVEPGVFYRDFEKKALEKRLILPCYTASKNLCAIGGMVANNSAGERTLRYGQMENFVLESKWIFADGNEYTVSKGNFDTPYSKQIFELVKNNHTLLERNKPHVSKNSAGYYLWNVCPSGKEEDFDLNKLLVGSQGTLGIMTEAKVKLVEVREYHDMVALFLKSWDALPQVVNAILPLEPESLETFDEATLKLGIRFMPKVAKRAGANLFSFASQFLPEVFIGVKMGGMPKLVVLVEIAESTEEEVKEKVKKVVGVIENFNVWYRVIEKDSEENKFWTMRRESFNLLREYVGNKKTAPFVEDVCINPDKVPAFLPRALKILKDHGIEANIAGHAGNGNFHIIPLMELSKDSERKKIALVSEKFYDLVKEFGGSITGEHNDGIIRTPYLNKMYTPEVLELFKKTKEIFDPQNIFNPGKKIPSTSSGQVGGTIQYLESHIAIG